jgi:hypothetical protein
MNLLPVNAPHGAVFALMLIECLAISNRTTTSPVEVAGVIALGGESQMRRR